MLHTGLLFNPSVAMPTKLDESGGVRIIADDDTKQQNVLYFSDIGVLETFALQLQGIASTSRALAAGKLTLAS